MATIFITKYSQKVKSDEELYTLNFISKLFWDHYYIKITHIHFNIEL